MPATAQNQATLLASQRHPESFHSLGCISVIPSALARLPERWGL